MFSDENLNQSLDEIQSETEDSVKKAYGQKYFEFQKLLLNDLKNKLGRSERIEAVVEDIMDPIRSVYPEITYRPNDDIRGEIAVMVFSLIPIQQMYRLTYFFDDSKPENIKIM